MATNVFKIPLTNISQKFDISLSNKQLTIINRFNQFANSWFIDILDGNTSEVLVSQLPLITGADLLEQYKYLGIDGKLIVFTNGDLGAVPTLDNLGVTSNLYFVTET